jgi:hypothetical protein
MAARQTAHVSLQMRAVGISCALRLSAMALRDVAPARGQGQWTATQVARVLQRLRSRLVAPARNAKRLNPGATFRGPVSDLTDSIRY